MSSMLHNLAQNEIDGWHEWQYRIIFLKAHVYKPSGCLYKISRNFHIKKTSFEEVMIQLNHRFDLPISYYSSLYSLYVSGFPCLLSLTIVHKQFSGHHDIQVRQIFTLTASITCWYHYIMKFCMPQHIPRHRITRRNREKCAFIHVTFETEVTLIVMIPQYSRPIATLVIATLIIGTL